MPSLLTDLTPEQLFFLSFANAHCSNDHPDLVSAELKLGMRPPKKYRVNVPLAHTEKFAQAFKCKAGSKMNPVKKCTLN